MSTIRIKRKLETDTLHVPELRHLIGKDIEITVEERQPNAPSCFSSSGAALENEEIDKEALRKLLTDEQFEALIDIAERGGPDTEAIERFRAASET